MQTLATAQLDQVLPIAKARLINHYDGSDDASIADDNTSAFNSRIVAGTNSLSLHAPDHIPLKSSDMRTIILAAAPLPDTLSGMESGFGQQQRLGSTTSDRERSGR
jgi:hypothetical protein